MAGFWDMIAAAATGASKNMVQQAAEKAVPSNDSGQSSNASQDNQPPWLNTQDQSTGFSYDPYAAITNPDQNPHWSLNQGSPDKSDENKNEPKVAEEKDEEGSIWDNKNKRFRLDQMTQNLSGNGPQGRMNALPPDVNKSINDFVESQKTFSLPGIDELYGLAYTMNPNWENPNKTIDEGSAEKSDKEADNDSDTAAPSQISDSEFQKMFGISRKDYDALEQRDQFQKALENEALKNYYQDNFGIGGEYGYEQWRDLGETLDYEDKRNLVNAVFGLGEGADQNMVIPGWTDLYRNAGINMDRGKNNERDEQIANDIMEWMWGDDNIINMNQWITDMYDGGTGYSATKDLGREGASSNLGQYYLNTYGGDDTGNVLSRFRTPEGELAYGDLDNKDLAAWIMVQNLQNKGNDYFADFGQDNLDQLAAILGGAGDTAKFSFTKGDEKGTEWNPRSQGATIGDILAAAKSGESLPDVYNGEGVNNAVFSNLVDNLMDTISRKTGKSIKSSNKE